MSRRGAESRHRRPRAQPLAAGSCASEGRVGTGCSSARRREERARIGRSPAPTPGRTEADRPGGHRAAENGTVPTGLLLDVGTSSAHLAGWINLDIDPGRPGALPRRLEAVTVPRRLRARSEPSTSSSTWRGMKPPSASERWHASSSQEASAAFARLTLRESCAPTSTAIIDGTDSHDPGELEPLVLCVRAVRE